MIPKGPAVSSGIPRELLSLGIHREFRSRLPFPNFRDQEFRSRLFFPISRLPFPNFQDREFRSRFPFPNFPAPFPQFSGPGIPLQAPFFQFSGPGIPLQAPFSLLTIFRTGNSAPGSFPPFPGPNSLWKAAPGAAVAFSRPASSAPLPGGSGAANGIPNSRFSIFMREKGGGERERPMRLPGSGPGWINWEFFGGSCEISSSEAPERRRAPGIAGSIPNSHPGSFAGPSGESRESFFPPSSVDG